MDPSELHNDRYLTNFGIRYGQGVLIAEKVVPHVKVKLDSDLIVVYGTNHLKRHTTLLHDKASPKMFEWAKGTDESYKLKGYGLFDYVSPDDIANADSPLSPMENVTASMLDVLLLEKEIRAKTLVCTAASYGAANKATLTGNNRWDIYTSADSDPISDISTAKQAVYDSCGKPANVIAFDWAVGEVLSKHPAIHELVKYTDPTLLTNGGLPKVIEGLTVVEAGGQYDSAKRGQTMSRTKVWGTFCLVAYVNPKPTKECITLASNFVKGTRKKAKVYDEKIGTNGAWYVKQTLPKMDEKMIAANCGYLFTTVKS
jgi:hypothetical protein